MSSWMRMIACAVAAIFVTSCATMPDPKACAAVGAALGGGGGAWAGRETPGHDGEEIAGYGAAGLLVGGALGWAMCRAFAQEEEPAPEPEPAPPPPPPSEPAPPAEPPRAEPPEPDPCEQVIRLRGVNFDFDKAEIRPDAAVVLDEGASLLQEALDECPARRVVIEGHTDAIGTESYNQGLSERRAEAVRDYLVQQGVPPDPLRTVGFGETRPVADNDTADGRAMNRRVELRVTQP